MNPLTLIDCTVYTGKPVGGIPGTLPGVYEDRVWRPSKDKPEQSDTKRTKAWAASLRHKAIVMADLEPMLMAGGGLGDIMKLLGDIRDTRKDLTVYVYVGGRLWPHIDAKAWHPLAGGSHPQVLRAQVLIGEMHRIGLCDGLAVEAYPPAMVAHVGGVSVLNEPLIARYMQAFLSNLPSELGPFVPQCPIVPVLGTQFVSGHLHTPLPPSLFKRLRDIAATRFDVALVWGGPEWNESQEFVGIRPYADHASFFEDAQAAAPALKLTGQ